MQSQKKVTVSRLSCSWLSPVFEPFQVATLKAFALAGSRQNVFAQNGYGGWR